MDYSSPFGPSDSEINPQRMNGLYPPQHHQGQQQHQQQPPPSQQQQFASVQQRDHQYQQAAKNAIQSQPGASLIAPFAQHQGGPGQAGMNVPGGPGPVGGMNMSGAINGPNGHAGMMPGGPMGGAAGMNQRRMGARPNMPPMGAGMNMNPMGGGMRPGGTMQPRMGMGAQGGMGPNLGGQGGMVMSGLNAQGGMPGQVNMSLGGGQGNMGTLGGQGPVGNMPNLGGGSNGISGPSGMPMGNGPNPMSMGGGSGMPNLGAPGPGPQGNMAGLGPQQMGPQSGMASAMGNVMPMAGGGAAMSNLAGGGGMGGQQGAMGNLGGLRNGPNPMGPNAGGPSGMGNPGGINGMGSMNLNGMGPSGGPGMSGGNGLPSANGMGPSNRQWQPDRPFTDDLTKRPGSTQLDDFGGMPSGQHPMGGAHLGGLPHGGPQHGPQPGQQGPQHGVGGAAQHGVGPQHAMGAPQQQQPPGHHAGSPVGGLPAHHPQHHPVPTHINQGPSHMGPNGTPRMNNTPGHPGGPPHMPTAPSPHHMSGSPAHHQNHPHQPPHHLVGSPAHQMGSPRHMTSSSPAPGATRSGAPTPVPPNTDPMMGMRTDGLGRPTLPGDQGMMRMGEGMMVRGPDGSMRAPNEMMMTRDGRMVRDGMLPMERAPSADGMARPGGGMRPEIGRLGPDGTMVRGPVPYGQPPYGGQGPGFQQSYVLTPAQQHQNMQMRNGGAGGVSRAESVDDMPILSDQMGLPSDMGDMVPPGPVRRTSMPPQMTMVNGPGAHGPRPNQGPGPAPGGPVMMTMPQRRPTMMQMQQRPALPGTGVLRMLKMSQDMSETHLRSLDQWVKFRNEHFTPTGKINMTIFEAVEGRTYEVPPELIARFFLTFFENGVAKMSISMSGAKESSEDPASHDSVVESVQGIWRYELTNGWVVEHCGPIKARMVPTAEPHAPGDPVQYKLKIQELTFNAPVSTYLFNVEKLQGTQIEGNRINRQAGPMTPRISPGLVARKPEGSMGDDPSGNGGRDEEMIVYENARFPPKPFQRYGLPENVWRLLVMSTSVHELGPIMQLSQESQNGPLATLEHFADMDREARMSAGLEFLPDDLNGHQFPNFASGFDNPTVMPNSSPAMSHPHAGMHDPQGPIGNMGRPGPMRMNRNEPLAGSGDLPPVPGLSIASHGVMQSPSLQHAMPSSQINAMKRKHNPPEQGQEAGGSSGAPQQRGMLNNRNGPKPSPAAPRKKAKTNAPPG